VADARTRGILLTLAGAFWAAGYLVPYKVAASLAGPARVVLPMLLLAAVFNTVAAVVTNPGDLRRIDRVSVLVAVLVGALSALGNEAMAHALFTIDPGTASVLLRTQVVFVALGGCWLLSERVTIRFWIGTGLALVGFTILRGGDSNAASLRVSGMAWALLTAVCFAAIQIVVRRTIHRIEPMVVNSLRLWLGAGLVALIPGRAGAALEVEPRVWLLAAAAALFGPVLSRLCLMAALRHIPAALSTLVLFAAPVFAFILGGLVLGTWPGAMELAGSLVILLGVALPVLERPRRPHEVE
jgi:drug/metabolite transporter (DMT)-like permease